MEALQNQMHLFTFDCLLQDKSKKDMVSTLNRYGLFIFDECHHCMKEHAYNGVMRQYFNLKHKQSASVDLQLPQVSFEYYTKQYG